MQTVERRHESGLEVQLPTDPEVAAQPYQSKYYIGDGGSNHIQSDPPAHQNQAYHHNMGDRGSKQPIFNPGNQSGRQRQTRILSRSSAVWMLAVVTAVCLIVAMGAGLGKGLSAQHRPSSPR